MELKLFMTKSKDGGLMWCGTSGKVHLDYSETLKHFVNYGIVINSIIRNYPLVVFSFSIHTSPKCLPSENPLWQ